MRIFALGNLPEAVYATVGGKASGLDLLIKNGFTVGKFYHSAMGDRG